MNGNAGGRVRDRARIAAAMAAAGVAIGVVGLDHARADNPRMIPTANLVPLWNQHDDFRDFYRPRPTDIRTTNDQGQDVAVPYADLTMAALNVRFRPADGPIYQRFAGNPAMSRRIIAGDLYKADRDADGANIAGGGQHCAPTAAGMRLEWARQTVLKDLPVRTKRQIVDILAESADTNDQNAAKNNGDNLGHLGTRRVDLLEAENAYIASVMRYAKPDGPRVKEWKYSKDGYIQMINRNLPVMLMYKYTDRPAGHAVIGVGYHIADPDDATAQFTLTKDPYYAQEGFNVFQNITDVDGAGGAQEYTLGGGDAGFPPGYHGEPGELGTSVGWQDTRMSVIAKTDYGNAPSSFDPITAPAGHRDSFGERLGATCTGEIDKFEALDDDDGVANISGYDGGNDGVGFAWAERGQQSLALVTVGTTIFGGGARYDAMDASKQLYLGAWADFNGDRQWTPDESLFGQFIGGPGTAGWALGDSMHTLALPFVYPVNAPDNIWFRFRLGYGEAVGPTGFTEFGEVEDYLIPAPGVGACIGFGLLMGMGRRRRA
jgi:hypothetical protein